MKVEREVLCNPCLRETIEIEATKHCKTCNDPEPLCDVCAQHHTRRKETKEHEISEDMQQLVNLGAKYKYVIKLHIIDKLI